MDRKSWKVPAKEDLRKAYNNRGQYSDQNNRKYIFTALGNEKVWKVSDKSHKVRLLPVHPVDNINFYGLTVHVHTNVGVNGDQYLCLKRMKNIACPICEQQISLWDAEPEMAKELYPQTRYLVWMVDLSLSKDKQVAQIWSCPRTAMDDVLGVSYKKATDEILNLANIDDGIAIYFDREKTPNTTFSKYKNFQLDGSPTQAKDEWLEGIVSFSDIIEYATYDEIKNVFLGLSNEDVSPKKDVSPSVETTARSETVLTPKEEIKEEVSVGTSNTTSIDDMSRDELEALAITVLSEDFEESEIGEMGTKKLRRLIKEAVDKTAGTVKEETPVEDPKEALKKKLRERVNS